MRKLVRGVAALALVALTGLPAGTAGAAGLPKPRLQEWWFSFWDIENKVWPITQGQGVTVAVVDSGVNASLPGLQSVVLAGTNVNRGGSGDGRIDTDKYGHGTEMAELIAGQGQDDGMVGVAPGARVMPIVSDGTLDAWSSAIHYAVDHGAQVIDISQGSADDEGPTCIAYASELQDAVAYAAKKNVVVVAGAGNQGNTTNTPVAPANCAGVLAVGAIDGRKLAWTHSEHQPYVAVAAPGLGVGSVGQTGRYVGFSDTSAAAALTSGAVALVRARYPSMPARDVVQKIINTTVEAGPPGHDTYTGNGAAVPIWALTRNVDRSAPNPPYERLDQWLASEGGRPDPTPSQSSQPGEREAGKKQGESGFGAAIVIVGVLCVATVVTAVVLLARRTPGGSPPVIQEQPPFPGGPGRFPPGPVQFPPGPGPYGGHQDSSGGRPVERPHGPPPAFPPPEVRRGPHG